MAAYQSKKQLAREQLRNKLWPASRGTYWPGEKENGWAKVPRGLPLVLLAINQKQLSAGVDLTATYVNLLCRNMNDGVVEIDDDEEMAKSCGLSRRTWALRMKTLKEIGLIEIESKLSRKIGYVLLRHPVDVVRRLWEAGKVSDVIWRELEKRTSEMGGMTAAQTMEAMVNAMPPNPFSQSPSTPSSALPPGFEPLK